MGRCEVIFQWERNRKYYQLKTELVKISNNEKTIEDVQIMAVPQLACYKACLHCKARDESVDDTNGRCSKQDCRMLQRLEFCTGHVNAQ